MMKTLYLSATILALGCANVSAQTFAVGGGASTSHAGTIAGVGTHGLAVGAAGGVSANASQGAGIAVSTPLGGLSAGIGQSNSLNGARAGVIAGFGGSGVAGAGGTSGGIGLGGGITSP